MFADGVFNCDPHPGNLLVRNDPARGPVPVLLDFGLCKRLPLEQKLAFCEMVVALSLLDADSLVSALDTLGLKFPPDVEPFQLMKGLAFTFRDTEADAGQARSRIRTRLKLARADRQRLLAKRKAREEAAKRAGKRAEPARQAPALPGVIAYFYRTLMMLQGLSTNLGVSLSFMPLLTRWASHTLLEHRRAATTAAAASPRAPPKVPPPVPPPRSALQERTLRLLHALVDTDAVLGAQVCLLHRGVLVVDAAVGRMGPVDPRPVRPDCLFQLFGAGSAVLATIALQQAVRRGGALWLQTPLANLWPAFAARGKEKLTLLHLLSHQSGMRAALPPEATLAELCDTRALVAHVAGAAQQPVPPAYPHEGLPWGCVLWGVLEACTGLTLPELLAANIAEPLGLRRETEAAELLLTTAPPAAPPAAATTAAPTAATTATTTGVPPAAPASASCGCEARVATHDASALLRRHGLDLNEVLTQTAPAAHEEDDEEEEEETDLEAGAPAADSGGGGEGGGGGAGGGRGGGGGALLGGAPQHLLAPHFLNMRQLRAATLPGVSMHGSARALARFYDGVGRGRLLPAEVVAELPRLSASMRPPLDAPRAAPAQTVRWAAGFQLGEATAVADGATEAVLGHGAAGGTVGMLLPGTGVALAVTVSRLTASPTASRRLVDALLDEFGARLTRSEGLLDDA